MENELQILSSIEKNTNTTQRDLARHTGMSLGNVNILIKRLVKKGLLKIERVTPRTIRYILTPAGIKEKAELTYRYIVISVNYIKEINVKIDAMINQFMDESQKHVILFGRQDEVFEMLKNKLDHCRISYHAFQSYSELESYYSCTTHDLPIITWHPEHNEELVKAGIKYMDLL